MKPYIIDRIVNPETNKPLSNKQNQSLLVNRFLKQTAEQVLDLLEQVVIAPEGTGKPYYIEGFDVAGKTGTAQIRNPDGPGYIRGHGENIFSFLRDGT